MSSTLIPATWFIPAVVIILLLILALLAQIWASDAAEQRHDDHLQQVLAAISFERKSKELVREKLVKECSDCARFKAALEVLVNQGWDLISISGTSGISYAVTSFECGVIGTGRNPHEALLCAVDNLSVVSANQAAS